MGALEIFIIIIIIIIIIIMFVKILSDYEKTVANYVVIFTTNYLFIITIPVEVINNYED